MRKINPKVLLIKNEARLQKMIREEFPREKILKQERKIKKLKEEVYV